MATKSMNINIRVNPDIKAKADPILAKMGLTATQLYNILLSQVAITKSVPFPIIAEKEIETTPEQDRMIWTGIQKSRAERGGFPVDEVFDEIDKMIEGID